MMNVKNAVIISYKASEKIFQILEEKKIFAIVTKKVDALDPAIDDHVDLQIHPVTQKLWMSCREHYSYYKEMLKNFHIEVLPVSKFLKRDYPNDCLLNAYHDMSFYFANRKAIDPLLQKQLRYYYQEVEVSQGYTKCSIARIGNTLVSSDRIILEMARRRNILCEEIPAGDILLEPYDTGFIGGTCGMINDKEILFYGDIEKYRYCDRLFSIFEREGITPIYPKGIALEDRGSIFSVHEEDL